MVNVTIANDRMHQGARIGIAIHGYAARRVVADSAPIDSDIILVAGVSNGDAGRGILHVTAAQGADIGAAARVDLDAAPKAGCGAGVAESDTLAGIVAVGHEPAVDDERLGAAKLDIRSRRDSERYVIVDGDIGIDTIIARPRSVGADRARPRAYVFELEQFSLSGTEHERIGKCGDATAEVAGRRTAGVNISDAIGIIGVARKSKGNFTGFGAGAAAVDDHVVVGRTVL